MSTPLHYRVAIRDAGNTADELLIGSVPTQPNPWITAEPSIDGAKADLIDSTVDVGSATIRVWDEFVGTPRVVVYDDGLDYGSVEALNAAWPVTVLSGAVNHWSPVGGGVCEFSTTVEHDARATHTLTGLTPGAVYVAEASASITGFGGDPSYFGFWTPIENTPSGSPQETAPAGGGTVRHRVLAGSDGTAALSLVFRRSTGGILLRFYYVDYVRVREDTEAPGRIITRKLADPAARQTLLSRLARIEASTDGGDTWAAIHRGYVNSLEVDAGEWTITIGDSTRQEQQTELWRTRPTLDPATLTPPLPMPLPRVGLLLGGPIAADATYGLFAGVEDSGTTRWHVEQLLTELGHQPGGSRRVVRLKFDSGKLRPWYYDKTRFEDDEWVDLNDAVQPYFVWDPITYRTPNSATVNHFGFFPDLWCRLAPVGGGAVREYMPIARPVRHEATSWEKPKSEYDNLTGNDSVIYVDWDTDPFPAVGAAFDITCYSDVISDRNPLLLAGHPVDLVAYAAAVAGIPIDDASRVACRAAIGDAHWFEGRFGPQKFTDFVKTLGGSYGFLLRPNVVTGLREFVPTRVRPGSSFAVTMDDRVQGSDGGDGEPVIWTMAEDTVVNVVSFETERLRRWVFKKDEGQSPIDFLVTSKNNVKEARGDTSVNGNRTITFTLPGQMMRRGADGGVTPVPLVVDDTANPDYPGYAKDAGGVLIDFAGWGTPSTEVLVDAASPAAAAQLGDEGTLDLPDLPVAVEGAEPVSQRGQAPRVVRVTKRSPEPGAVKFTYVHAGALSQTPVAAPASGASTATGALLAPTITLAASTAAPTTAVTVTLTNGATLATDNLQTDLQLLAQTATPSATTDGTAFGPVTTYDAGNATTIDTPAVAPGSTVWVRARSRSAATGVVGAWTAWASVTLGLVADGGTTAAERPYAPALPTIAPTVDAAGVVSATVVASGAASVKLAAAVGSVPTDAAVRAATADTSAPFTFASVATIAAAQTAYLAAYAYDAAGNESAKAVASIMLPGTGSSGGAPGGGAGGLTRIEPFFADLGGLVLPAIGGGTTAVLGFYPGGPTLLRRADLTGARQARLHAQVVSAASAGALRADYTARGGSTWAACSDPLPLSPVGVVSTAWTVLPTGAQADVDLRLVTTAGDGAATAHLLSAWLELAGADFDPDAVPPAPPTTADLPTGPTYVLDLNARTVTPQADNTALATWHDDSGTAHHATGGGAKYRTAVLNGFPAVETNPGGGSFAVPLPTTGSFTLYVLLQTTASYLAGGGNWYNGAPIFDGEAPGSGADFGVTLNTGKVRFGIGGPDTTIESTSTVNDGDPHLIRCAWNATTGAMTLHIDGVLEASGTGPGGPRVIVSTVFLTGGYSTGAVSASHTFFRVVETAEVDAPTVAAAIEAAIATAYGVTF